MENVIQTKHKLDFGVAQSHCNIFGDGFLLFQVGTCEGQWGSTKDSYFILSIKNRQKGNGHLDDVFEWFEHSAKRDEKNLMVLECMNKRFYRHLLAKRGFVPLDAKGENCIKIFNLKKYKRLLKNGNEIINKGTLTCV